MGAAHCMIPKNQPMQTLKGRIHSTLISKTLIVIFRPFRAKINRSYFPTQGATLYWDVLPFQGWAFLKSDQALPPNVDNYSSNLKLLTFNI